MNQLGYASFDLVAFLTPKALWIGFGIFFIIFGVLSAALIYHWRAYALMHHTHLVAAEWWYLAVSVGLFGAASALLVLYTLWY